ncbi:MAG TPA: hypothetical protein VK866_12460 [Acidimicrobiales bacterium]|nr:hypothetical protein [Acidimicrobiales bacterium]
MLVLLVRFLFKVRTPGPEEHSVRPARTPTHRHATYALVGLVILVGATTATAPAGAQTPGPRPVLECVHDRTDGVRVALFGYLNQGPATTMPSALRGATGTPPSTFAAGRHRGVFVATGTTDGAIVWSLNGRTATAGGGSPACTSEPHLAEVPVAALLPVTAGLVALAWWRRTTTSALGT